MKKETLEDFCIEFVQKHFEDEKTYNPSSIITAMKVSAKWQQERSYSEEEVDNIFYAICKHSFFEDNVETVYETVYLQNVKDEFIQFKNKK